MTVTGRHDPAGTTATPEGALNTVGPLTRQFGGFAGNPASVQWMLFVGCDQSSLQMLNVTLMVFELIGTARLLGR